MQSCRVLFTATSVFLGAVAASARLEALAQYEVVHDRDEAFATRSLSREELDEVMRWSDVVIDKSADSSDRFFRAQHLGNKYGHRTCLPALLGVVRDDSDVPRVRRACAVSLTYVPDRRVIDQLIELLLDEDANLAFAIHDSIIALTHIGIGGDEFKNRDPESPGRKKVHRQWRTWWSKNRDTAKLYWSDAFGSKPGAFAEIQPYHPDEDESQKAREL